MWSDGGERITSSKSLCLVSTALSHGEKSLIAPLKILGRCYEQSVMILHED